MDPRRSQRVSEAIKEELAELIAFEMGDPRVAHVDISEVEVSPDSKRAIVRVVLQGEPSEQKEAMAALERAKQYLRTQLAHRLSLRRTPELQFFLDRFPDAESRVEVLLKRARKSRSRDENPT